MNSEIRGYLIYIYTYVGMYGDIRLFVCLWFMEWGLWGLRAYGVSGWYLGS